MTQQIPDDIFYFYPEKVDSIKKQWEAVMSLAIWGDLLSDQIGKTPRMRKRLLDLGESIKSYFAPKDWIDQPRQQLKSALGSSIKLRDSLEAFKTSRKLVVKGADIERFNATCETLEAELMELIVEFENKWAQALDSLGYDD